jgi:hypothetical protein
MYRFKSAKRLDKIFQEMDLAGLKIGLSDNLKEKTVVLIGDYEKTDRKKCLEICMSIVKLLNLDIVKTGENSYSVRTKNTPGDYTSFFSPIYTEFYKKKTWKEKTWINKEGRTKEDANLRTTKLLCASTLTDRLKKVLKENQGLSLKDISEENKSIFYWMMCSDFLRTLIESSQGKNVNYFTGPKDLVRIEKLPSGDYIFEIGRHTSRLNLSTKVPEIAFSLRLSFSREFDLIQ